MSARLRHAITAGMLIAAQPALAETLEPGRWRVVTTNLSGGPLTPQAATRCLTPSDVADLGKTFGPEASTVNSTCVQKEFTLEPSRLKWHLECRGQLDMDVAGEFLFTSSTRYTAMIATQASLMGQLMQRTLMTITAERVGDCD